MGLDGLHGLGSKLIGIFLQCLAGVVDLMAHPNSPVLLHSPTPHHGHMTWCHYSWDHVIPTLKQWLKELNGLKVRMYFDVGVYTC